MKLHKLPLVRELFEILTLMRRLHMDVQTLLDKVTAQTTVIASVDTLMKQLAQEIRDAGTDQAKLQQISDTLDANSAALSQAVTDGTPAA